MRFVPSTGCQDLLTQINALRAAGAPESESAGQDLPDVQAVRLSPVLSAQV
jgi:hypothetical protein